MNVMKIKIFFTENIPMLQKIKIDNEGNLKTSKQIAINDFIAKRSITFIDHDISYHPTPPSGMLLCCDDDNLLKTIDSKGNIRNVTEAPQIMVATTGSHSLIIFNRDTPTIISNALIVSLTNAASEIEIYNQYALRYNPGHTISKIIKIRGEINFSTPYGPDIQITLQLYANNLGNINKEIDGGTLLGTRYMFVNGDGGNRSIAIEETLATENGYFYVLALQNYNNTTAISIISSTITMEIISKNYDR